MPQITDSIVINAPRPLVLEIAMDNERFPEYMADVQNLRVLERSAGGLRVVSEWTGIVPRFHTTIRWTEEDIWNLDLGTCTFQQLHGDYDRFEGTWMFTEVDAQTTRFDSFLDYALEIPLVGAIIQGIVLKTMTANLRATLEAIKARSEALHAQDTNVG